MASELTVSAELAKSVAPADLEAYRTEFKNCDADGSGAVDPAEIRGAAAALGNKITDAQAQAMVDEADLNGDHLIEFEEFVKLMEIAKKTGKQEHLTFVSKGVGAHSWSLEEKEAFANHINFQLRDDEFLKDRLPMDPESMDLFNVINDGILIAKLVNTVEPDTVDERALTFPKKKALNVWQRTANANLAIGAAKALGCRIVNFHVEDMLNCLEKQSEILVLGMLWQIVKLQVTQDINLKTCPEIAQLREGDEELADLLKLKPEDLLLRWFNYHLAKSGSTERVKNFGSDLQDGTKYVTLLNSINSSVIASSVPGTSLERASVVVSAAKELGVPVMIKAKSIADGDKNLNLAFCAQIFNTVPGLVEVSEEERKSLEELMGDEDASDSREERVFRMWMNSLHLPDIYITNVFDDLHDGLALLHAIDAVEPGTVDWKKKVNKHKPGKTMSRYKMGENCSYAVKLGKGMGFSLVGIGSADIMDGNKKLILAFLWQLMRYHLLKMLRELGGGKKVEEKEMIAWANKTAGTAAGQPFDISSFKDKKLKDGRFLLRLVAACEPRAVDFSVVHECKTEDEYKLNARYTVSVARKAGAAIFLTWEDIVEVKPKMLLTIIASLMMLHHAKTDSSEKK